MTDTAISSVDNLEPMQTPGPGEGELYPPLKRMEFTPLSPFVPLRKSSSTPARLPQSQTLNLSPDQPFYSGYQQLPNYMQVRGTPTGH